MSLGQIKQTGEQGRGMALAGVITGYVGLAFIVLAVIVFLALLPLLIADRNCPHLTDPARSDRRSLEGP